MSLWTHKTTKQLRRFGLSFGAGLSVLSGLLWWRDKPAAPVVSGVAVSVLLLAALAPRALAPLEWLLERVFKAVTLVATYIILTVVYVLVFTPLGLAIRVFGHDTFGRRFDRSMNSYWKDVAADGPSTRPDKPF